MRKLPEGQAGESNRPRLELVSEPTVRLSQNERSGGTPSSRPYVGIIFRCCGVYARIYRNAHGSAYEGHCPRCARPVRIKISPDGIDARFFEAF